MIFSTFQSLKAQEQNQGSLVQKEYPAFTAGISLGYATANSVCSICNEQDIISGSAFSASVGFRLSKKILVDFLAHSWIDISKTNRPRDSRSSMMARGLLYLSQKNPIFLSAGIGIGNYFFTPIEAIQIKDSIKTLGSVRGFGICAQSGLGYEWRISEKYSMASGFNIYFCDPGNLSVNEMYTIHPKNISVVSDFYIAFRLNTFVKP